MDLDDDELRATRERLGNVREYRISYIDGENRYYIKTVYIGGNPPVSIVPVLSKKESASFDKETAEKYLEILKEVYSDSGYVFNIEEV